MGAFGLSFLATRVFGFCSTCRFILLVRLLDIRIQSPVIHNCVDYNVIILMNAELAWFLLPSFISSLFFPFYPCDNIWISVCTVIAQNMYCSIDFNNHRISRLCLVPNGDLLSSKNLSLSRSLSLCSKKFEQLKFWGFGWFKEKYPNQSQHQNISLEQ